MRGGSGERRADQAGNQQLLQQRNFHRVFPCPVRVIDSDIEANDSKMQSTSKYRLFMAILRGAFAGDAFTHSATSADRGR